VAGQRLNRSKMVWEYFVKSRKAADYREMMMGSLYHPPWITMDEKESTGGSLYLVHHFEGKPLVTEYVANTLLGIEFLWGGPVKLETSEVKAAAVPETMQLDPATGQPVLDEKSQEIEWERVLYTMAERKLQRQVLSS
jgi:stage V sporulation protein R